MKKLLVVFLMFMVGCGSNSFMTRLNMDKIEGERVVAFDAPNEPWVYEIQRRLKAKGFEVLRWGSTAKVTKRLDQDTTKEFDEAKARYIVVVIGNAYRERSRCAAGGFYFYDFSVDLVDTKTSQTLVNVNGSGYSENCESRSGTVFTDITDAIVNQWGRGYRKPIISDIE
jgi:hypothetical protein